LGKTWLQSPLGKSAWLDFTRIRYIYYLRRPKCNPVPVLLMD